MYYIGIDIMKIFAMFLIAAFHVIGHGGILESVTGVNAVVLWIFEILCYCGVNCYALASGFLNYGKKHRVSRYLELWLQVVFYGIVIGSIAGLCANNFVISDILKGVFPVTFNQYWYFTAYTGLFLLIPVLNTFIEKLDVNLWGGKRKRSLFAL